MNELTTPSETQVSTDQASLMMNPTSMQSLMAFAEMMSRAVATVPQHLVGKPADCLAIAMQAMRWGMDPFVVSQKTHIVSGRLGYEAQLVNAVIMSTRAIEGTFHYEYRGEGQDLACRVGAKPRGESEIVWNEWLRNGDVTTRNSPLWKTNIKQQLGYLQVKNWARLYTPGAILGVYTQDELIDADGVVHKSGPQRRSAQVAAAPVSPPMVDEVPKNEQKQSAAAAPASSPAPAPAAAKTPTPPPANGHAGGISGGQVGYLRNKLKAAGVEEGSICDRFQVTGIEMLNVEQFDELKSELLAMA